MISARRALTALAIAALALPAAASAAPDHAEIAFVHGSEIWTARADGSERRLLIAPARRRHTVGRPAWSPDGSSLAYEVHVDRRGFALGSSRLMVLHGTAPRALTPLRKGVFDLAPAWSPDGSTLAFARAIVKGPRWRSEIVTLDPASGAERTLARVRVGRRYGLVGEPAWSPDGATIAFTLVRLNRENDFTPVIRLVPASGGPARTLIRDAQSAAWSPDGSRLAFASVRDHNGRRCSSDECHWAGEIYTAAADGTGLRRLTSNEGDDARPVWSADGSRILFSSDRNLPEQDASEVYSMAADGSCLTWLTNGTPASLEATWRPGSGTRYDPGRCDPASRSPVTDTPRLPEIEVGLWLGPSFDGLLLSGTLNEGRDPYLEYGDCGRFAGCPEPVLLGSEHVCETRSFRNVAGNPYRLHRRRGAILAYYGSEANGVLFSGRAITSIQIEGRNRLADVVRIVRGLRPLGSTRPVRRLAPPRVPRPVARLLERTAQVRERHGSLRRTARALGIARFEVEGRLRMRRALRSLGPYRYASCPGAAQPSGPPAR